MKSIGLYLGIYAIALALLAVFEKFDITESLSFTNPSLLFAIGYSIVVLSPIGLFFGYLWTRTRNIALLVLVHGAVDMIPNVAEVARKLGIGGT